MHICTVAPSYLPNFGGAEVGTHMILSYLANNTSHRLSVITSSTDKTLPEYEIIDGVEIYRYYRPNIWMKWYAPIFYSLLYVPGLLKKLKPDLVNITYALPTGLAAWYTAKLLNRPIIMMLGGVDVYDPFHMPDRFLQGIAGYYIRNSNIFVANSTFTANRLASHFGVQRQQIEIIPFGVDTECFHPDIDGHPIRKRYNIDDDTILLFALQRLEIRKGVDILVKALKHVVEMCKDTKYKLIIGGRGRDKNRIENLISDLKLNDYVILAGFVPEEEKHLYYAASDIFTFHSYHEGLGIVIEEASACGLPIVTTRAGGTLDVVIDGETGLLSEPGDEIALANTICTLIKDSQLRRTMGQASAKLAFSRFSLEVVAQKLLEVFESIK